MGYLLKTEDEILMFYSEPLNGYYYDGRTRISDEVKYNYTNGFTEKET